MFKIIENLENPHIEETFSLFGVAGQVFTEKEWRSLQAAAQLYLNNLLVITFIQAVDQFRKVIHVKREEILELPLSDKFVVCSVYNGLHLDGSELPIPSWRGHQEQLEHILLAFTGIDPQHLADVEFIKQTVPENNSIELHVKVRMNINPDTGVKYSFLKRTY